MQIKKIYQNIKPELLFDELKDLVAKQGAIVAESKMETYSLPDSGPLSYIQVIGPRCLACSSRTSPVFSRSMVIESWSIATP